MKKRLLSWFLAIVLVIGLLPTTAFAGYMDTQTTDNATLYNDEWSGPVYMYWWQLFGTKYPDIKAHYSRWGGVETCYWHLTFDENGTTAVADNSAVDSATEHGGITGGGTQFQFDGNYWFWVYDTDRLTLVNSPDSIHNLTITTTNAFYEKHIYMRAYSLTTYSNDEYCTVSQKSVLSLDSENRTVKVYADGAFVGEWTGAFPSRTKMSASDLTVSDVAAPYVASQTTVTLENGAYRVDLHSQYSVTGSIDNGGSVTNSNQTVNYGSNCAAMVFTPANGYEITSITVNGVSLTNISKTGYTYPAQAITENKTVEVKTAKKLPASYTVSYDLDGGSTTSENTEFTVYADDSTPTIADPTKTGYVFAGWSPAIAATVTGNAIYVANWEADSNGDSVPDKYQKTVTFKIENGTWDGSDTADKVVYVTLTDALGQWSESGAAVLTAPTGMIANAMYTQASGAWTPQIPESVSGTTAVEYTYSFSTLKLGNLTITKSFTGLEPTDELLEDIYFTLTVDGEEVEDALYLEEFDCKDGVYSMTIPATVGTYTIEEHDAEVGGYKHTCEIPDSFEVTEEGYILNLKNVYAKRSSGTTRTTPTDLNGKDHIAYVVGFVDGTVRPGSNITRAETVTMLYRLLTAERRDEIFTKNNTFSDVTADLWYNKAVSSMTNGGYIKGYEDGTFGGSRSITRAEFVAMLARFIGLDDNASCSFVDVKTNHWAYRYIATATQAGWINGYTDGTFKPDQPITRAEAMTIINRVLNRGVDSKSSLVDIQHFPDNNDTSKWYYYEVIEATNQHKYTGTRPSENWTSMNTDYVYDIEKYEKP